MSESWKPVPGYEGIYEASSLGQIRSLERAASEVSQSRRGRILRPGSNKNGYQAVGLWRSGVRKRLLIHRLVLESFVGPCPDGMEACHNDGTRTNNAIATLRWASKADNQADRVIHGTALCRANHPRAKLSPEDVRQATILRGRGVTFSEIARQFGVSRRAVGMAIQEAMSGPPSPP